MMLPHEHSLFCERKQRVCSSVGKLQEHERLRVTSTFIDLHDLHASFVWMRSSADCQVPSENEGFPDTDAFEIIDGSEGKMEYELVAQDVDRYITVRVFQRIMCTPAASAKEGGVKSGQVEGNGVHHEGTATTEEPENEAEARGTADKVVTESESESDFEVHKAVCEIALGPVLAGPPRLLDLSIVGDMTVGSVATAQIKYIGGCPGESEFWWMRIRDGDREQISDPQPINAADATSAPQSNNDPRVYVIVENDANCILKVKCRPVRIDGHKGEIFTSKPSAPIKAAVAAAAAVQEDSVHEESKELGQEHEEELDEADQEGEDQSYDGMDEEAEGIKE